MQKRIPTVIISLLVLLTACAAQSTRSDAVQWKEIVSVEGRFKLTFPGEPVTRFHDRETLEGNVRATEIYVGFRQITFMLMWADLPNAADTSEDRLRGNYDLFRDGMLEKAGAKLRSEKDVRANGRLGREISLSVGSQFVKYRIYVIDGRQYQLITSRDYTLRNDPALQKQVDKFLDSFQLIEK